MIPGATVVVKNNATGVNQTVVTNGSGVWALPGLSAGTTPDGVTQRLQDRRRQ